MTSLKEHWRRWVKCKESRRRVDELNAAMAIADNLRDPAFVFPIILPGTLLSQGWPGPMVGIVDTPFALTWAEIRSQGVWTYVTPATAQLWDDNGVDWRRIAFQNLRNESSQGYSGEKRDDDDNISFLVMLQADAFGPSRLLIPNLFEKQLGKDYLVALPEQTCAIAYRKFLEKAERDAANRVIDDCFQKGTEPMSAEHFRADVFWQMAILEDW